MYPDDSLPKFFYWHYKLHSAVHMPCYNPLNHNKSSLDSLKPLM